MIKIAKKYLIILVLLLSSIVAFSATNEEVYETIMHRIRVLEWEKVPNVSNLNTSVSDLMNSMESNGSWSDLDYNSTAMTNWPGTTHLERLKNLALAYTLESSSHHNNNVLYQKIISGLTFFYNKNPSSLNWYVHQIGNPHRLGQILILMRSGQEKTPAALEHNILNRIKDTGGDPLSRTGANKVEIALHWVYRGCLSKDKEVLAHGVEEVFYPVFMTMEEGIQHDYSFFQHGQQLYTGGYAINFLQHTIAVASATRDTEFAMSQVKLNLLVSFFRDHFLNLIRGDAFLYNVVGRRLAIPGGIAASYIASVVRNFKNLDPENSEIYDAAISRLLGNKTASFQVPTTHYHYWRGDYTLTTSPDYTFDVRMASTRTCRSENGNGESLKGYFLTEGANAISIDGNEYKNIFPMWDWAMIPGTTLPHKTTVPRPTQWQKPGNAVLAGGVSNGKYGITAYQMNNPDFNVNTSAKKSWFMFGEEIVCLGADIKSTAAEEVNTTVNQCMQNGLTVVKHDDTESYIRIGSQENYTSKLDWIHHSRIAYFFPSGGNVNLSFGPQSGSWKSITSAQAATNLTSTVFKLWFKHGIKPVQGRYEYIIVPNKTLAETRAYDASDIVIAENGKNVQAVFNKKLNLWGFVFYEATTFNHEDFKLTVDAPCVLMLEEKGSYINGWLADPTQTAMTIKVNYESNLFDCNEEIVKYMPQKPNAGSTVDFNFKLKTSVKEIENSLEKNLLQKNPVNKGDLASLIFDSTVEQVVHLKLLDLTGKVIENKTYTALAGENRFSIETKTLNAGMYLACIISQNESKCNQLIVR